jgi:hypothetical protein
MPTCCSKVLQMLLTILGKNMYTTNVTEQIKVSGLYCHAEITSPWANAPIDRIEPQAGQGCPVINLNMQSTGPCVNPEYLIDSKDMNGTTIKKLTLYLFFEILSKASIF